MASLQPFTPRYHSLFRRTCRDHKLKPLLYAHNFSSGEKAYCRHRTSATSTISGDLVPPRSRVAAPSLAAMAPSAENHSRSHSLLLFQKLLNLRDSASPLTLVLDSLEQSAAPVLREFVSRAKISKAKVILLSFATLRRPQDVDVVVRARGKNLKALRAEILSHYPKLDPAAAKTASSQKTVVLLDSLNELATAAPQIVANFLSSIVMPAVSLVAVYHTDVPVVLPRAVSEYEPHPLTVLSHLATSILRLSSLRQEIERQRARNRSLQEPEWGLGEGREGVLIGLKGDTKSEDYHGVVVEMEIRRRSGRAMAEKFVVSPQTGQAAAVASVKGSKIFLLSEHPVFAAPGGSGPSNAGDGEEEEPESTFNLGLTEKQRRDREGIVLPYFDAQTDIGAGEGGRILYEMGREDDFDDEEDEI
ncbi:Histone acetylation protein 2 [Colletotrichum higginsianum IMI 349063]|uniref:Elongator complex protein 5 n=3 Tax=Colletotrichum higginsianum TaxID=80884 RepID=A0A1B7YIB3_COLHI|nr:Histone acetylation protein 2 [Colletotrichum higginsianum IMI 349063]OBR11891.1 Histone acetylation protein 2 [Colletotrichum higginsianum IMI 349063]